ncbi:MAG: hypothetical protein ABJC10_10120, partial [Acidobacteriota bacterium]
MSLRKCLLALVGMILVTGMGASFAFAQEPQSQTPAAPDGTFQKERIERMERHRERLGDREGIEGRRGMERRGGKGHLLRELNL